jgi:hypothetical protein
MGLARGANLDSHRHCFNGRDCCNSVEAQEIVKANLLCAKGGMPKDVEVFAYDEEHDLVLYDIALAWRANNTGVFDLSPMNVLYLQCPYSIETNDGKTYDVVLLSVRYVRGTDETLRVTFRLLDENRQDNMRETA